jgi:hypothetical protein
VAEGKTIMPEAYTVNSDHTKESFKDFVDQLWEGKSYIRFQYTFAKNRSAKQQAAMEVYFRLAAEKLNDAGVYQQIDTKFFSEPMEIPWTQESFKNIWKLVQNKMFDISSTTAIHSDKVAKVYDAMNRGISERTGVYIPFPSKDMLDGN